MAELPDIGQKKMHEMEIRVFEASLRSLVPLLKRIYKDGIPYGQIAVIPDGGPNG